ncbi:hypothetical protein BpHYR1_052723 [Brachionus plicatilis]|uniref:Uncharacterized protein n=1 Tax=Brachionus plicatilis TaxID=10195 RepID=A0A3M7SJW9_BRAPC|nr:hypothetical protein BpHYR1_052723 [Brachionus plicatilis]
MPTTWSTGLGSMASLVLAVALIWPGDKVKKFFCQTFLALWLSWFLMMLNLAKPVGFLSRKIPLFGHTILARIKGLYVPGEQQIKNGIEDKNNAHGAHGEL